MTRLFFFLSVFLFSINFNLLAQESLNYTPTQPVKIKDGQLWVYQNGKYVQFFVKAVGYQPTPIGRNPRDWGYLPGDPRRRINNILDDPDILNRDFAKLQQMNANAIRIWKGNDTTTPDGRNPDKMTMRTLDLAQHYHLKVIAGFWVDQPILDKEDHLWIKDQSGHIYSRQEILENFKAFVNKFKANQNILCWAIGNENNRFSFGKKNRAKQLRAWYGLVNDMALAAHQLEGASFHPVMVINLELAEIGNPDFGASDKQMSALDIWGVNAYRGRSYYTLFDEYHRQSKKPLFISEFGIDAWHVHDANHIDDGFEDEQTQADWDGRLWDEIVAHYPITIGGSVMEYSDEWMKDIRIYKFHCKGSHDQIIHQMYDYCRDHNHGGYKDGGFPGRYASLKWFGIMSISRNPKDPAGPDVMTPRQVYYTFQKKWQKDPPFIK